LAPDPLFDAEPSVPFNSVIVDVVPELFEEWRLGLLYRGSRDGFAAADFHRCCDGHAGTLTLIESSDGFRFGGFTPCAWDSSGTWKRDDCAESFLFTLRNPHGIAPRKFALKPERCHEAIYCGPGHVRFGGGPDLVVSEKPYSGGFGSTYANDSGIAGEAFFTGKRNFVVKEVEIFAVTN
jgi:hypothetical protein